MKYLKMLVIAAGLFCLAACSGSQTYSPEKCEELVQKVKEGTDLTDSDCGQMIDQMIGICNRINQEKAAAGEDEAKYKAEFADTQEARDMLGYMLGFAFYLDAHKNEISEANLKKLAKAEDEFKKLND